MSEKDYDMKGNKLNSKKLKVELIDEDLHLLMERYHYEESDFTQLQHVYYALEPFVETKVYWEYNPAYDFVEYEDYAVVAITLGNYFDKMQEIYQDSQNLREAYMMDCIGAELLMKAYQETNGWIQSETALWSSKIEFIGEKYPLERMAEILEHMNLPKEQEANTCFYCNEAYMLFPLKSAIYITALQKVKPGEPAECLTICESCSNKGCSNRIQEKKANGEKKEKDNWTYGYQKIFGK